MALSKHQRNVARKIIDVGREMGVDRHVIRVALGTAITEARLSNLPYGDRDSEGPFQQRPSTGWGPASETVRQDARQFYERAIPLFRQGVRGGALAQAVQRSAFPDRYQPNIRSAGSILGALGRNIESQEAVKAAGDTITSRVERVQAPAPVQTATLPNPLQTQVPMATPPQPKERPGESQRQRELAKQGAVRSTLTVRQEAPQVRPGKVPKSEVLADYQQQVKAPAAGGGFFGRVVRAAEKLERFNKRGDLPYLWGGGHQGSPAPGPKQTDYDCSGAVSWVLQKAGLNIPTMVSGQFARVGRPGPGLVTIFANSGHVFMKIGKRFFGTSRSNVGGGAGFIEGGQDTSGYTVRHIPVSREQAKRLGAAADYSAAEGKGPTRVRVQRGVYTDVPKFSDHPILSDRAVGKAPKPPKQKKVKRRRVQLPG